MSKENEKKDFCPSSDVPPCAGFRAGELARKLGAGAGLTKN